MLLHKKCPLEAKSLRCPCSFPPLNWNLLPPSIVLTQLFAEYAIKQIAGIISVKMKTPPLLSGGIFLTCNPRSTHISKLERADTTMWGELTSSLGMRRERDKQEPLKQASLPKTTSCNQTLISSWLTLSGILQMSVKYPKATFSTFYVLLKANRRWRESAHKQNIAQSEIKGHFLMPFKSNVFLYKK